MFFGISTYSRLSANIFPSFWNIRMPRRRDASSFDYQRIGLLFGIPIWCEILHRQAIVRNKWSPEEAMSGE